MVKKLICLLICVLFFSACHVNYDLVVTNHKEFIENITVKIARDQLPANDNVAIRQIEKDINNLRNQLGDYNLYRYNYRLTRNWAYITIERKHASFTSFKNSPFYRSVYLDAQVREEDTYQLKLMGLLINEEDFGLFPPAWHNDLTVRMIFYNNVVETNADEENFLTNTFIWQFSQEDNEKDIIVELDYSTRYDILIFNFLKTNILSIILLAGIIVVSLLIYGRYMYASRTRNQI